MYITSLICVFLSSQISQKRGVINTSIDSKIEIFGDVQQLAYRHRKTKWLSQTAHSCGLSGETMTHHFIALPCVSISDGRLLTGTLRLPEAGDVQALRVRPRKGRFNYFTSINMHTREDSDRQQSTVGMHTGADISTAQPRLGHLQTPRPWS